MIDGIISDNTASASGNSYGGGVYAGWGAGTLTMTGGTISGNTAKHGGGVFIDHSTSFTMTSGTITGNTANNGGGVYIDNGSTFTMTSGTITSNTANYLGGGVEVGLSGNSSTFVKNGGTISATNSAQNGKVAYHHVGPQKRDAEAGPGVYLDTRVTGSAGGWETIAGMVLIPAGTFTMGSPTSEAGRGSDETQHSVTISKAFFMGKYEVTQKEWVAVMGSNPSNWKGDNLPVEMVTWYEVVEYCNKLSVKEGLTPAYTISGTNVTWNKSANGYRLPTEAEWEYTCRAGTTTPYYSGSSIDNAGWYSGNSGSKTHEVGGKQANAWGLYDMHGNVWEWCWDWYGDYASGSQTDPTGATSGANRVYRSGGWDCSVESGYLRSADHNGNTPNHRYRNLGFRLVRP
jgi:formylglycine-generating enzyme required for sulfatase activity